MVVTRKIAVQPSSRFPESSPYTTTKPEPIPARLINTCTSVNVGVVMPKIMCLYPLSEPRGRFDALKVTQVASNRQFLRRRADALAISEDSENDCSGITKNNWSPPFKGTTYDMPLDPPIAVDICHGDLAPSSSPLTQ